MKRIGYARVSTEEQSLDMQTEALEAAGCARVYREKVSAGSTARPQLSFALKALERGDQLVVWKLDRLGRSVAQLVATVDELRNNGVELVSLTEGIDTKTAAGTMVFHVIAAMAEMERGLISERVRSGMASARRSGRHVGRPPKITPQKVQAIQAMVESGMRPPQIASALEIGLSTVKRALAARNSAA